MLEGGHASKRCEASRRFSSGLVCGSNAYELLISGIANRAGFFVLLFLFVRYSPSFDSLAFLC